MIRMMVIIMPIMMTFITMAAEVVMTTMMW